VAEKSSHDALAGAWPRAQGKEAQDMEAAAEARQLQPRWHRSAEENSEEWGEERRRIDYATETMSSQHENRKEQRLVVRTKHDDDDGDEGRRRDEANR
jgi:hypothetical protein